jgi:hypothetical protein
VDPEKALAIHVIGALASSFYDLFLFIMKGTHDGFEVGPWEGRSVWCGPLVGRLVGCRVGASVGTRVGRRLGTPVGLRVGAMVGGLWGRGIMGGDFSEPLGCEAWRSTVKWCYRDDKNHD